MSLYNDYDGISTNGVQVDMLAGLAQLEFDILGLDSWWIGLTDQGHEGRCSSHPFNFILIFLILLFNFHFVVPLTCLYFRWVWEHSFTEADFTDWADGYPTAEDNVADCAVMSHDQVGQNGYKLNIFFHFHFDKHFSTLFPRDGNGWTWHVETGLPLPFVRWMKRRQSAKNKGIHRSTII